MVVQRRPAELQAEVPTSVYAVNLERLSELLQIPEDELVSGFQAHPTLSEMHGVIVDAGEDVPFEAVGQQADEDSTSATFEALSHRASSFVSAALPSPTRSSAYKIDARPTYLCKQVLLTAAARPSTLDSDELPKCLIPLGSQTIISHILTQLYAAGIERVVISVAAGGNKIIQAVKRTPFYSKMDIEFLDLGPDNRDGHARSILAARQYFRRGPFMIHTADHIFDKSLITKFMNHELYENVACVLVETDIGGLVGLPETTVKAKLGREKITKIGRELTQYDGIEAGLFLSSTAIFDALDELATKKAYFSFAEALDYFTKYNKVTYVPTSGETWFSIETEEQLAYTMDGDGVSVLSPWTVFLATTPQQVFLDDPTLKKNVVIGISAPDQDTSLRVAGTTDPRRIFDGFIVGVTNADRRDEEGSDNEDNLQITIDGSTPLLAQTLRSTFLSSTTSKFSRGTSFMERGNLEDSFVISFPMDDETSQTMESISSTRRAYLIEMNPDPTTPMNTNSQFMLAVPGKEIPVTPVSTRERRRQILPSDIQQISLETRVHDDDLEVTVVVKRSVPLIGYLLLLSSLFTVSSVGVALAMEDNVAPLLKLFWRQTGTCMASLPLALFAIRRNGPPALTRDFVLTMLLAGASYAFYLGSYVISLDYTSVGHATLFNNAHSLLIVVLKLIFGQYVALLEGTGAVIGVLGGALTAMDATEAGENIVSPAAFGDMIALAGSFGGAAYFINAKKLRPNMDLVVFLCCLTFISGTCLLFTMLFMGEDISFSADMHNGLFGWINPVSDRLLIAFYLVFVCDLIGTMGYISVMKYFDPIVISVVCLLEPIIANVMGIIAGVDAVPGLLTFFGATLVIAGTILVITTQSNKTEQLDATEAIKSAVGSPKSAIHNTPKPLYSARMKRRTPNYGSVA
ncbi:hypothetical protein Poli38472_003230 [Pythium oligandrum]|uniref:MobA-like NTP transferase domain-containing protein n=1 Tax=Pythium oligandrum TaxID=41045 RepID=A0A8K1C6M8_PYTOL|nr:hypothetical protein Poli38472_003230 [Pythium oligandrum]|eukprot:TMW57305.1 hypothetical protein Poli38472_003230 [Pythium oligandrum]